MRREPFWVKGEGGRALAWRVLMRPQRLIVVFERLGHELTDGVFGIVCLMEVTFTRTGERRYSIAADRGRGPVLHMPVGPGYDAWLPHDVVHFVVERHFEIAGGVFGQLAAGGTAGTFFPIPHRRRDRARGLSERLGALGRQDTARSERLAGACLAAWHARHGGRWEFADTVAEDDAGQMSQALLAELDEVANRWHALTVGGALTMTWPWHLTLRAGSSSRGRRQTRDRGVATRRR